MPPVNGRQILLLSICLHFGQLFICAKAWIHKPIIYKLVYIFLIQLLPLRLPIGAMRSTDVWPCNASSTLSHPKTSWHDGCRRIVRWQLAEWYSSGVTLIPFDANPLKILKHCCLTFWGRPCLVCVLHAAIQSDKADMTCSRQI